ncbi:MAG: hypothetical protein JWL77_6555 [Chthonomonadaceae bacterium]|nr:hypothetical protein [Chthonomonadaceae bacterium]
MHKIQRMRLALGLMATTMSISLIGCSNGASSISAKSSTTQPGIGAEQVASTTATSSSVVAPQEGDPLAPQSPNDSAHISMIGTDRRKAVVFECWYALRQSFLSTPNDNGPTDEPKLFGDVVGGWNYLANDTHAMEQVKSIVGEGNYSVASNPGFNSGDNYAFEKAGSPDNRHLGRGGQCTYFTCLILYRALNGFRFSTRATPAGKETFLWADLTSTKYPSATGAQPGDVVFKKGTINHIGICVMNFGDGTLDIVDSNDCGFGKSTYAVGSYGGYYNSEMIGRHRVNVAAEGYRVFSGNKKNNPLGWY